MSMYPEKHVAKARNRIDSLDYLRGIAAMSVMFYHYYSWSIQGVSPLGFISKVGLYAVSIFYVLSGLTLYLVYVRDLTPGISNLIAFFIKRFFRIYPLLWLVIFLTIGLKIASPSLATLSLNLTGLFGIADWSNYIGTGVWSIGNELAFYFLFPLFWLMAAYRKFGLVLVTSLILFLWFAFFGLNQNVSLNNQWHQYVNPLNQVFLFVSGMAIARYAKDKLTVLQSVVLLFALAVCFTFYPAQGNNLVTGIDRIVLGFVSIFVCLCVFQLGRIRNDFIHACLKWMGDCSYSIYLLHPVVYFLLVNEKNIAVVPLKILLPAALITSLVLSFVSFHYYERVFVNLGNRLTLNYKRN